MTHTLAETFIRVVEADAKLSAAAQANHRSNFTEARITARRLLTNIDRFLSKQEFPEGQGAQASGRMDHILSLIDACYTDIREAK